MFLQRRLCKIKNDSLRSCNSLFKTSFLASSFAFVVWREMRWGIKVRKTN